MTTFVDCSASDLLEYPEYFRATYDRGPLSLDIDFKQAFDRVAQTVAYDGAIVAPIQPIQVAGGEETVTFDFRVADSTMVGRTVREVVEEIDTFSYLAPLSSPRLATFARVTAADVYGSGGEAERRKAADDRASQKAQNGLVGQVEAFLGSMKWLAILVVVALVLWFFWEPIMLGRSAVNRATRGAR